MRGEWVQTERDYFSFRDVHGRAHAVAYKDSDPRDLFGGKVWVSWTYHTEGNNRFETADEARRDALLRLERLLAETESLR